MITRRELTQDNVQAFGVAEAAKILKKQRVPFAIAYWLIFGQAPRKLHNPPSVYAALFARVTGRKLAHI